MQEPKGELGLADPRASEATELSEHRSVRGDSRRDDDGVGRRESFHVVSSQLDVGSQGLEVGCTSCSRGISAEIRDIDFFSLVKGQSRRGFPAGAESENCRGRHRIFSVLKATMAQRIPRIQKRITTFDSGQPSFSKW